jgi:ribosome recycling factor
MNTEEILTTVEGKMRKAVDVLKEELATIRTGRASPGLVSNIKVDYHGVPMPINQIASISVPEARMLVIQPWERDILPAIDKAILKSDLGLNPTNDGNVIRLTIPQLTEERRIQLVKSVRKRIEEGKVAVRNVRRDGLEKSRELKDNKELSEDEQKRLAGQLQQITDRFTDEIDNVGKVKEAELLEL